MSLLSQFYGGDSVGSNLGSYPGIYASDPVSNIYPPTLFLGLDITPKDKFFVNVSCPDPYRTVTFNSYRIGTLEGGGSVSGSFVTKMVDVWYSQYYGGGSTFTINAERLENIDGLNIETNGGVVSIANCPLLTTITRIGIIKTSNFGFPIQYYFNNNALNQSSVDAILVALAAGDGIGPSGFRSVNIAGGTNSTPGSTGLAAKATLVAAGWTVTNN
jgi:hypothetical protein